MNYGGIDNGNQGALVLLDSWGDVVSSHVMPILNVGAGRKNKWVLDKARFVSILQGWQERGALFVVLEKAQPMPGQGVTSMFKVGRDFGCAEMALQALEIRHEIVHPRTWQGKVLRGIEGKDTKARAVLKCQRMVPTLDLYPGRKTTPHDGLSDAACMALYGMELRPPMARVTTRRKTPPVRK